MKKLDVRKLVVAALLASLTCVVIILLPIRSPFNSGYFNIGDSIVLLCGWLLGPIYGSMAAGIGAMIADVYVYALYAPATFVIKALMAVVAYYVANILSKKRHLSIIVSAVLAEIVMILGYFIYEAFIIRIGMGYAIPNIAVNAGQGFISIICAVILKEFIDRKKLWRY